MACSALAFYLFSYQVHEKSILLPLLPVSLLALPAGSEGEGEEEVEGRGRSERRRRRRKEEEAAAAAEEEEEEKEREGFLSLVSAGPPSEPFLACWLPVAACFSMWPLLHRDGLAWAYAGCLVLWVGAVVASRPEEEEEGGGEEEEAGEEEGEEGRLRQQQKQQQQQRQRRRPKGRRTKAELALLYGPAAFVAGALALHACHALVRPPAALPWLWDAAITTYCAPLFLAAFAYLNLRMWFGTLTLEEEGEGGGQEETASPPTIRAPPRRAGPAATASSSRAKRE